MNLKQILIVSIILTILTIGVVSASDDVASDDNLAAVEGIDDSVSEVDDSSQKNDNALAEGGDDALGYDEDEIYVDIYDEVEVEYGDGFDSYSVVSFNSYDNTATGDLKVYVNNSMRYSEKILSSDYYYEDEDEEPYYYFGINIALYDLEITTEGTYDIKVTFNGQILEESTTVVTLVPNIYCPYSMYVGETEYIYISYSKDGIAKLYEVQWDDEDEETLVYMDDIPVTYGYGSYSLYYWDEGYHEYLIEFDDYEVRVPVYVESRSILDNFEIYILKSIEVNNPYDYDGYIGDIYYNDVYGTLSLLIDDDKVRQWELDGWGSIFLGYEMDIPFGESNFKFVYTNETDEKVIYDEYFNVDYYMEVGPGIDIEDDEYSSYVYFFDNWAYFVRVPNDATGVLSVSFAGNALEEVTYNSKGKYVKHLSIDGLSIGAHKIKATLSGDDKYPDKTVECIFYVTPVINVPDYVSVGENDFITVEFPQNYEGAVVIYNGTIDEVEYEDDDGYWHYDEIKIKDKIIGSSNVVNGFVKIPIENLVLGRNTIFINCSGSSGNYEDYFYIRLIENSPRFSSNINSNVIEVGEDIILTITAPRLSGSLLISLDGKTYKDVYLDKTAITEYITKLSIGEHHIKLTYSDYYWDEDFSYDDCYSVSYYVTVKDKNVQPTPAPSPAPVKTVTKLTLKKVKVKKSAKKLTITATLKINGKAVKGKIIKFKFNKKSYKAKTNKKGVAKITVKKAVLKKLKVGKKVTYTAKYGKITKKVTVKVKK